MRRRNVLVVISDILDAIEGIENAARGKTMRLVMRAFVSRYFCTKLRLCFDNWQVGRHDLDAIPVRRDDIGAITSLGSNECQRAFVGPAVPFDPEGRSAGPSTF